jgi:hypothetical protein
MLTFSLLSLQRNNIKEYWFVKSQYLSYRSGLIPELEEKNIFEYLNTSTKLPLCSFWNEMSHSRQLHTCRLFTILDNVTTTIHSQNDLFVLLAGRVVVVSDMYMYIYYCLFFIIYYFYRPRK